MKGVQFLVDERGNKSAVLVDLKKNRDLWEDFYDRLVARNREHEPRESSESVKARLVKARSRAVAPKGQQ